MSLIKNMKKEIVIALFALLAVFVFSMVSFVLKNPGNRYVFYFNDLDTKKVATEVRYLAKNPVQGKINLFVDELLLGPLDNRFQPLFSRNTVVKDCFLRDDTLYLNISEESVLESGNSMKVKEALNLLVYNIEKNFRNVKKIEVFINNEVLDY